MARPAALHDERDRRVETYPTGVLVRRLLKMAWEHRMGVILLVFFHMTYLMLVLSGLAFIGLGIDIIGWERFGPGSGDTSGHQLVLKQPEYPLGYQPPEGWSPEQKVLLVACLIVAVGLLRFALERFAGVTQAKLVQGIVVDLRAQVYDKLQRLSFRFFDANASGSIINRVAGDVQRTSGFINSVMVPVLAMVVSLVFYSAFMFSMDVFLTICCLASTPLLWLLTGYFSKIIKPAYLKNRKLMDSAVEVLSENVQGVRVVKGFARQAEEKDKFAEANRNVRDQQHWIFKRISIFTPVINFLPQLNLFVMLLLGGWIYLQKESFSIGDLIVFSGLLSAFSVQVGNVVHIADSVQMSLIGAGRVFEILDTPLEVASPPNARTMDRAAGAVTFEQMTFAYDDEGPALEDINLDVEPGQCIAILGSTGAGKSTLLSLIPRFYDPQAGRILIDGHDLREYDLQALRQNIGVVFQESFLFSNTVAANIAFGHPDASEEQIRKAAQIAQADTFIREDLEKGYETLLSESGANLSGGQRQRIALARAILLEPPILLLDDPTAAIDPETEHEIMEAMEHAMLGRTTFVVAHRLSTLRRADKVIVLDHGRIVEMGTHEQLMAGTGHYRHAADLQLADEHSKRLLEMI